MWWFTSNLLLPLLLGEGEEMAAGGRHSVSPLATTVNAGVIKRQDQTPEFFKGPSFLQGYETKTVILPLLWVKNILSPSSTPKLQLCWHFCKHFIFWCIWVNKLLLRDREQCEPKFSPFDEKRIFLCVGMWLFRLHLNRVHGYTQVPVTMQHTEAWIFCMGMDGLEHPQWRGSSKWGMTANHFHLWCKRKPWHFILHTWSLQSTFPFVL